MKNEYYKPRKTQNNWPVYKKLIKSLILSLVILGIAYFWFINVLGNINIVWGIFKRDTSTTNAKDTVAPDSPIIREVPEAINKSSIDIKGYAENGSTVKIYVNAKETTKNIADNEGNFFFSGIDIKEGPNELYATAIDQAGNISESSRKVQIVYDKDKPKITITNPDSSDVSEQTSSYQIEGTTEPNSFVTINSHRASIDYTGTFRLIVELNEGANNFKIEAKDRAGNTQTKDLYINFSKDN